MSSIFGFRGGPSYRAATPDALWQGALDQPMSAGATFWDQAKGGMLESFGLGSAIRDAKTPDGAPLAAGRYERPEQFQARRDAFAAENKVLDEEAYKTSPYFRDGVPWDASMTEDKAAALATMYDAKRVREYFAEKRPITSFFGNLAGQATDPINYIPVAGPAVKAAAVARMGVVKGVAATAALDAAANTAIAGLVTRETRRSYGDDVSWQMMVSEIATAALLGTAFGTVGGLLERRAGMRADALRSEAEVKVNTLRATQEARIALNEAIGGLANDGEVRLSPNGVAPIERVATDAATIERPPTDEAAYLPAREMARAYNAQYEVDGQKIASSREVPSSAAIPPVGSWRIADMRGLYGRDVEQLREVRVDDLVLPELRDGQLDAAKRGDDATYAEWIKQGKEPPPVELIRMEDGRLRVSDGHRRVLAAKSAGMSSVKGWVSELVDTGKVDASGKPMKTGLTYELAQRDGPKKAASIDASPARPEPPPTGRAEAEAKVAKPENYKALADQYRVDPEAGTFPEEAELRQLAQAGRLSDEDMAVLNDADAAFQDGAAYGKALESVVNCLV